VIQAVLLITSAVFLKQMDKASDIISSTDKLET